MAITQINTANTFEQWLIATQQLIAFANSITDASGGTFTSNTAQYTITGNLTVGNTVTCVTMNTDVIIFDDGTRLSSNVPIVNSYNHANGAFDKANSANVLAQNAYNQANAANVLANSANSLATSANNLANSANILANSANTLATSANTLANSANALAQAAFNQANTDFTNISTTAGVYGDSTIVPVFTVAANGRISSIANVNISTTLAQTAFDKANSANVLAQAAFDQANTDATNISISSGTYGNATAVPVITVAANGRISSITNTTISTGVSSGLVRAIAINCILP